MHQSTAKSLKGQQLSLVLALDIYGPYPVQESFWQVFAFVLAVEKRQPVDFEKCVVTVDEVDLEKDRGRV